MLVDTILCELQVPSGAGAQWVHLLTHGQMLARDGRQFVLGDAKAVLERTLARAGKAYLPIDYEHQTDHASENGRPAPAAGWMTQFAIREDGLWALVEWTQKARAMLAAREYRYISPTFLADRDTGQVRVLLRAALTNNPALELTALASARSTSGDRTMHIPKEIADALGLTETASVDDAVKAIQSRSGAAPEMASTMAAMANVVKEMNELKRSYGTRNVSTKVETAIRSGVFPPALREWATELCTTNEASFDAFIAKVGRPFAYLGVEHEHGGVQRAAVQPDHSTEGMIAQQLGVDPAVFNEA